MKTENIFSKQKAIGFLSPTVLIKYDKLDS